MNRTVARRGLYLRMITSRVAVKQVRTAGRNPAECIRGAVSCNGALVTVDTDVVPDLQLEGAVTKGTAAFHAFAATDAQRFFDGILKEGVFDIFSPDGAGRTKLVLGARVQGLGVRFEVSSAEITVPAHGIHMNALDGGRGQYAVGSTTAALDAFSGVKLPYQVAG